MYPYTQQFYAMPSDLSSWQVRSVKLPPSRLPGIRGFSRRHSTGPQPTVGLRIEVGCLHGCRHCAASQPATPPGVFAAVFWAVLLPAPVPGQCVLQDRLGQHGAMELGLRQATQGL